MKNDDVAQKWVNGLSARNSRGNMTTDGVNLYSYDMLIGITAANGEKLVINQMGQFRSTTATQRHARACHYSIRVITPAVNDFHDSYKTNWDGSTEIIKIYHFPAELLAERKESHNAR